MKKIILSVIAASVVMINFTGCKSTEEKLIKKTIEEKIEEDKQITFEDLKRETVSENKKRSDDFIQCMIEFETPIPAIKISGEELDRVLKEIEAFGLREENKRAFELFHTAVKMSAEGRLSDKEFSRELRKFSYLMQGKTTKEMNFILFDGEVKKVENGKEYNDALVTNALHTYVLPLLRKRYSKESQECLMEVTNIDPVVDLVDILVSDDETRAIAKVKRASDIVNSVELEKQGETWVITKS